MIVLHCRTYTHARRFPLVIGKVGGYALPTPLTPAQVGVLLGTVALEVWTRRWWAHLPALPALLIAMALPLALAWAVRHATVEGRSPLRYARGALGYATRPRHGRRAGVRVRPARPLHLSGCPGPRR
jgi:hypothetical protein